MVATYTDRISGVATAVAIKAPVRVATTANISLSGLQTIDGITLVAGDRVLVKDQTTATENGIYVAATGAWTRAADFDGARDVVRGTRVFSAEGTTGSFREYFLNTASPVIGSTTLDFATGATARTTFDTFTDMVASSSLIAGQIIDTAGKENIGDGGAAHYHIVAAGTYTADGWSVADIAGSSVQAVLLYGSEVKAEWAGVVLDADGQAQERSAEFNAAFQLAATAQADTYDADDAEAVIGISTRGVNFSCHTDFLAKDVLYLTRSSSNARGMRINWSGHVIATTGGDFDSNTRTRPLPLVLSRLRNCKVFWPYIECEMLCSGVKAKGDIANEHYAPEIRGYHQYGLWKVANNDSIWHEPIIKQFVRNPGWTRNSIDPDDWDNWIGDSIVITTKDHGIKGGQIGWGGPCVRITDEMPESADERIPGQNCYWCGLESGQGYLDGDNGGGDVVVSNIHMMQAVDDDGWTEPRYGAFLDYDLSTETAVVRRVDSPIGILSYCKVSNLSFFDRIDNDGVIHLLYGAQIELTDELPGSSPEVLSASTDTNHILDPRIRIFASRGNAGAQRYPFMASMRRQRQMTIGLYDNPAEIYWNGSALVEASTSWNGDYDEWNRLNRASGSYDGQVQYQGRLAAGTHSPSVSAAGDYWVLQGAVTINPGSVSGADGQILYALTASPAGSGDWLVVDADSAPVRQTSRFETNIIPHQYNLYPENDVAGYSQINRHTGADRFSITTKVDGATLVQELLGSGSLFSRSTRKRIDPTFPDYYTINATPGTTDMRSAIIAAGDYVNDNGGGKVNFLPQVYAVSDECLFDDYIGVEFIGCGTRSSTTSAGTEIKLADGANKTIFKFTHSTATEKSRIKVKGIGFNGNRANQTYATCYAADTGHAIHISDVDNVEVSGCWTRGLPGHSVYFTDGPCNDSKLFNNFFYDSGRTGIKAGVLADSEIYNNEIAGAGKYAYDEATDINDGIAIGSDGNIITGNAIWQVVGPGVDLLGERNLVTDNRIDGCTRALIQVDKAGNVISNNQLFGAGVTTSSRDASPTAHFKSAIRVKDSASDTLIVGNHCSPFKKVHGNESYSGVQNYGIYDEGAVTKITANKCNGNYLDGIYAGGSHGTVRDNDCIANRQMGIRITGTGLRVEQNNCFLNDEGINNTGTGSVIRGNDVSEVASGFSSTLSADMGSGDSTISVASASGLTIGDPIVVTTDNGLFYLNWVENIVSTTITLRHPINGGATVATSGNAVVNARQAYGIYLGNAAIAALSGTIASGNATANIFDNNGAAHTGSLTDLADLSRDSNSREVTISSGAITVRRGVVYVDTESDAATDDLDTITAPGAVIGDRVVLRAQNGARTVVVKNGTGNIYLQSGADYSLDDTNKGAVLTFNGTAWNG